MLLKRKLEDDLDNLSTESSESEEDVEGDKYPSNELLNPTLQLIERARLVSLLKQKEMVDSFGLNQPCRLFPPSALTSTGHPAKKKAKKDKTRLINKRKQPKRSARRDNLNGCFSEEVEGNSKIQRSVEKVEVATTSALNALADPWSRPLSEEPRARRMPFHNEAVAEGLCNFVKPRQFGEYFRGDKDKNEPKRTSCHWCRQKMEDDICLFARCSRCSPSLIGIVCAQCLEGRYGENVNDIDPSTWTCPPCRGICNCSGNCRKKKCLPATDCIPCLVTEAPFDSAAHVMILSGFQGGTHGCNVYGFDRIADGLSKAIDIQDNVLINRLIDLASQMELDQPVRNRKFNVLGNLVGEPNGQPRFRNGHSTNEVVNELKNLIEIAKHGQRSAADNTKIEVLDINVAETTISFHKDPQNSSVEENKSGNDSSTNSSSDSGLEANVSSPIPVHITIFEKEDSFCTHPKRLWRSTRSIVERVFYSALQANEMMTPRGRHSEVGTSKVPCQKQITTKGKSHLRRSTRVVRPTLFQTNPFNDSIAMRHEVSKPTSYWG
eukprot:8055_1